MGSSDCAVAVGACECICGQYPICGDDDPGYPESGAGRRHGSLGSGVGAFDGYGYWRLRNSDRSLGKRSWYLSGSEKRTFYRLGEILPVCSSGDGAGNPDFHGLYI